MPELRNSGARRPGFPPSYDPRRHAVRPDDIHSVEEQEAAAARDAELVRREAAAIPSGFIRCPECKRAVKLRVDGTMARHAPRTSGRGRSVCVGYLREVETARVVLGADLGRSARLDVSYRGRRRRK